MKVRSIAEQPGHFEGLHFNAGECIEVSAELGKALVEKHGFKSEDEPASEKPKAAKKVKSESTK